MVVRRGIVAASLWAACIPASPARAQQSEGAPWEGYEIDARIWLDRGAEPVLQKGERVRVYYRVSEDASVAIFHINTDGTVRLVFPRSPRENQLVVGGRDYRVLFPETSYWFVDEYPGMGYFFIVASPEPLDLSGFTYSYYDGGWDLSRVGRQVYSDPYDAIDDYVAVLIPDWETAPYGLGFASYNVGESHDYPRFLCYDCHGFTPYYAWNPYYYACTSFRVVVYDDPFYYPSYRYGGAAVVYPATRAIPPRYVFKERAQGEAGTPLVARRSDEELAGRGGTLGERDGTGRSNGVGRAQTGPDRRLPTVVPWPGGRTTAPTARTPVTRGSEPPRTVVPLTDRSRDAGKRPVLEPRSGSGRRRGGNDASPSDRLIPSGTLRPSRTPTSGSSLRDLLRIPFSKPRGSQPGGRPTGRPSGGSVRPPSRSPSGGAAARPAPAPRSAPVKRPAPSSNRRSNPPRKRGRTPPS